MKPILLFALLVSFSAQAQHSIKGKLFDSLANKPVVGATITILKQKDSSLVSFSMSDSKGVFEITNIGNGAYRILLTHINYHNTTRSVTISDQQKAADLGTVVLNDLAHTLEEVTVTAEAPPVTLIGDTIQYNASSFKTPPNASVEQLLKNMPGMKVEKDGSITSNGKKVNRVMVDGKEFFGTDPKVATKNLPADAVDKVQAYDRLSDAAQLTGIDDGNSERTINLKLKKDKKKGGFGKATAGAATDGRYEGRLNLNSFKGARQASLIGTANNINAEGFSPIDMLNFSNELSRVQGGGGGGVRMMVVTSDGGSSGGTNSNASGINTIHGGGFNYNNLIGNNTDFTSNLFYNRNSPFLSSEVERQYLLPDSSYLYNQKLVSRNTANSVRLNLGADIRLDSFHSVKISPSFGYQKSDNNSASEYATMSLNRERSNEGSSRNNSLIEGFNFRNDIIFRKKFRTKGRTFSMNLQTTLNRSKGNGTQNSNNRFFDKTGSLIRQDSLNQYNKTAGELWSYNLRVVYTEPIMKNTLLEFSGGKNNSRSQADKTTYDFNKSSGKFDDINPLLTNDFTNTYGYTNAGVKLRAVRNKLNLAIGVNGQQADLEGKVVSGTSDSVINKRFYNLLPNARIQYNFTKYRNLTFTYYTNTNQPSIDQLQPIPDISDPLNIKAGNPDLKQEYSHSVQINMASVNPFRNKSLFGFLSITETSNKIVNFDVIDQFGIKTTTPVNIDGVITLNGMASWGFPIRAIRGSFNLSSSIAYNDGTQFVNGVANKIKNLNLGPQVRLDLNLTPKIFMNLSAEVRYSNTNYSLQAAQDAVFIVQEYGTDFNWELPKSIFFNTSYTYTINTQQADGFNTRFPLWNASVSKQFLKFNRGELKLTAFDILNKNIGISRSANQNFIEDKRVNNLKRYLMMSFTYSLR
ncbi:MAG: hypothetical protein EOO02_03500 [Chitinophagaceae bacterium]|nr:MAG: hypothetical protein EOO02_03500 [Chitinophagaceae bacterium]